MSHSELSGKMCDYRCAEPSASSLALHRLSPAETEVMGKDEKFSGFSFSFSFMFIFVLLSVSVFVFELVFSCFQTVTS